MSNELMRINYSEDQVKLIKSQIAPKATDDELKLFLYQCQRTGLDALSRQIYAIHRWNSVQGKYVMTIQTSIDGFRTIAERSGDYAGQDEPIFTYKDEKLVSCKITVYRFRGDIRYPAAVGVAYWNEYVQTDKQGEVIGLWLKMPHVMLAKVAEALALRKAYPQDLSGLYTSEEMSQADTNTIQKYEIDELNDNMRDELHALLSTSTYDQRMRDALFSKINGMTKMDDYVKAKANLLANQGGIDVIPNPSQKDIKNHIKKVASA